MIALLLEEYHLPGWKTCAHGRAFNGYAYQRGENFGLYPAVICTSGTIFLGTFTKTRGEIKMENVRSYEKCAIFCQAIM